MRYTPPQPDPTPAEIRQRCREVQATWTEQQRRNRAGLGDDDGWTAPVVHVFTGEDDET